MRAIGKRPSELIAPTYFLWRLDFEELSTAFGDSFTTLFVAPNIDRQAQAGVFIDSPRPAALKAISARSSIGNRITSCEGLFMRGHVHLARLVLVLLKRQARHS